MYIYARRSRNEVMPRLNGELHTAATLKRKSDLCKTTMRRSRFVVLRFLCRRAKLPYCIGGAHTTNAASHELATSRAKRPVSPASHRKTEHRSWTLAIRTKTENASDERATRCRNRLWRINLETPRYLLSPPIIIVDYGCTCRSDLSVEGYIERI